jgi:hypothetical protein
MSSWREEGSKEFDAAAELDGPIAAGAVDGAMVRQAWAAAHKSFFRRASGQADGPRRGA